MKTRQEIKLQAKTNMGKQRGTSILLVLLIFAIALVLALLRIIPILGWIIYVAGMCVLMVWIVNTNGEFISVYKGEKASVDGVANRFPVNFWRKLGGMWWEALWTFLWSLLFLVPGIVKSYSYFMTSYILADCPDVTAKEALKLSMRMTQGHKGKLFVMHLSFIAWLLLSACTLYILLIVYVGPYMQATMAGYYVELRDQALANGVIKPEELGIVGTAEINGNGPRPEN